MAFDRTNPAHLALLKSEEADDPIGMGYLHDGADQFLLNQFNFPSLNVGGESINRPTEDLDVPEIAGVIDGAEYDALSAYDKLWVGMLINRAESVKLKPFQTKFMLIFPGGSATLTAVLALRSKLASRAEVLFGVNTNIRAGGWHKARDS